MYGFVIIIITNPYICQVEVIFSNEASELGKYAPCVTSIGWGVVGGAATKLEQKWARHLLVPSLSTPTVWAIGIQINRVLVLAYYLTNILLHKFTVLPQLLRISQSDWLIFHCR